MYSTSTFSFGESAATIHDGSKIQELESIGSSKNGCVYFYDVISEEFPPLMTLATATGIYRKSQSTWRARRTFGCTTGIMF